MSCCVAVGEGLEKMCEEECHDCKTWEAEIYWKRFKPLHFCQILAGDSHQELAIPKKFADKVKSMLPPMVTLRGPSGVSWTVGLTMRDDGLFFRDGWGEFVKANSLQEKNILIFKYDVNSCFDVLIFDGESLCEKESSYFIKKCRHLIPGIESPKKWIAGEANLEEELGDVCVPVANNKRARVDADGGKPVAETNRSGLQNSGGTRRKKTLACKAVYSKRSPGKRLQFKYSKNLKVPSAEIGKSPGQNSLSNKEELSAGNQGNPMDVDSSNPHSASPEKVTTSRGRPGKVLKSRKQVNALEINGSSPNTASSKKVTLAKFGPGSETCSLAKPRISATISDNPKQVGRHVEAMMLASEKLTDDSFISVMRPSSVSKRFVVTVPHAWCTKHLSPQTQDLILRVKERAWIVRISQSPGRSTGQIYTGWKQFALDNQLRELDVCLFKLVKQSQNPDQDTVLLDVTIFRANEAAATLTTTVATAAAAPSEVDNPSVTT